MSILFDACFIVLLASCTVRHVVRTMSFFMDWRLKAENRTIERFKH